MAEQIAEGVQAPEEQVPVEESANEVQETPAVEEGAEAQAEAPAEDQPVTDEAATGTEEAPAEAPKKEPQQPTLTQEQLNAVANWNAWQAILERNPELKEQARAAYQKMISATQTPAVRPQQQEMLDETALKREYNQLVEQGKHYEANRLLVQHDPEVIAARQSVAQIQAAEHAKAMETAASKIAEHTKSFGPIEDDVRSEMTDMFSKGFGGDLVTARVAALTKLGRIRDAQTLLNKAASAPQKTSSTAGGRTQASKGAPAPRRVAKAAPTPGSGFSPEELDYIDKRERQRGGGL